MRWWNDNWLDEGFATWMERKPIQEWHPEWHAELDELQGVQGLRALRVQVALDSPKLQERINQGADQWPVRQSTS